MPELGDTRPLDGMRIGLVTAWASRLGGGVFEAVVTHSAMLQRLGASPQVFGLHDPFTEEDRARFGSVPVIACPVIGPRQIGFAPRLASAMLGANLDCLHLHGIWMYPSAAASHWAMPSGRPYIISPHGMLDRWITARGKAKKALARTGYERRSWARATAFHALTTSEAANITLEARRQEIHVVPNAGPELHSRGKRRFPEPVVAYIGRIHEKKNLVSLVEAWSAAQRPSGARLVIAGWGGGEALTRLRDVISQGDGSAEFIGPVYGEQKQALLDQARFVALPSYSEGLPMAILEAWAGGVPTLMTAACNLPEGFAEGAAMECGYSARDLSAVITRALGMGEMEWQVMADAATGCARRHFSPDVVARAWTGIFAPLRNAATANASMPR